MKKKNIVFKNIALVALIISLLVACDRDFSSLDSDVVNSENTTHFKGDSVVYPIVAYNKQVTPFQSNGLPANLLGYYNDPTFGGFSANFVAQLVPTVFEPDFENSVLDSVVLSIPYYSTIQESDGSDGFVYKLDSIYGDTPIRLSIYQNNYFLRDFDPDGEFSNNQAYYSDGSLSESNSISPAELEGELLLDTIGFTPSDKQIKLLSLNDNNETDSTKLAPRMRFLLHENNETYWEEMFLNKTDSPELSNQNNFTDYFRGLYFKAEPISGTGSMTLLNFSSTDANITIYYTKEKDNTDGDNDNVPDYADVDANGDGVAENGTDTDNDQINDIYDVDITEGQDLNDNGIDDLLETTREEFVLNFSGNSVNILDNDYSPFPIGDEGNGDEKLYLKGGEGNMAVIDLFNGLVENDNGVMQDAFMNFDSLFRTKNDDGTITAKRLINEAFIEFYVDQSIIQGSEFEPNRILIYKLNDNSPLIDYYFDQSIDPTSLDTKISHLVPLTREDEEDEESPGVKYKIRITEHLTNLFLRDSSNTKLGLVVTSDVNSIDTRSFLNNDDEVVNAIPIGTLLSPKGTVLYGNNSSNQEKKAKLTIYYTEPETDSGN